MSRPGDVGWTLIRYETDDAALKHTKFTPLPGDPRPVVSAARDLLNRHLANGGGLGVAGTSLRDALEEYES